MIVPDPQKYIEEKEKWKASGSPLRQEEKVKELFVICESCDNYKKICSTLGQCKVCTCFLRPHGTIGNKLAWATTKCPLDEPKWIEEPEFQQKQAEPEVPTPPENNGRKPKGGCGCSG